MTRYITEAAARAAAVQVLRESWDPGGGIHINEGAVSYDGKLDWADALASIQGFEAIDSETPDNEQVEMWSVLVNDPPCTVSIVVDAAGEVCAAGLFDDSDF